ncbi:conserved hypothetical protein [Sporisorium reilianum SRZ2]|uniref:FAD dependent oxidoreductase domain-containing protein n=1 Tax=Sporisorium reilianum (strain SRZ2) TaxID=999809 RepID=E7A2B1_SPORE|nr:conserved hypothetical protein [Sporisorium reilianum SRZ2]
MSSGEQEYVDISTIGIDQVAQTPAPLPSSADKATTSYWMATTATHQLPDSLEAPPAKSDVVVIGSGITGVSTAYHLVASAPASSSPIASITIVEARSFCSGATARNGGHLTAVSALAYTDLAANPSHLLGARASRLSKEEIDTGSAKVVEEILEFERHTADAIRSIIADEHVEQEIGFTDDRNWHFCFEQAEVDAFEQSLSQAVQHAGLRKFLDQVRRVPKDEVDIRMKHPAGILAVYEIPGATLHPRALVSVIFKRAQRIAAAKGISLNIITDLPVVSITSPSPGLSILSTAKGDIEANYVVHATNGYASHLLPQLSSSDGGIIPTRAQVVAVAPTQRGYLWGMGLSAGGGYEYGHQRPESEAASTAAAAPLYILGGGREYADGREWGVADDTALNPQVSAFLHPYMGRVFPNSYSSEGVQMEWTGIMGYTKTKDPLVGPVGWSAQCKRQGKEYVAVGYSGHGMTRAFGCARVVADMILADATGGKWVKREPFPECYLTAASQAAAVADADTESEKRERDSVAAVEPVSRSKSVSCCVAM